MKYPCCHLNIWYCTCFEQEVPWHSGNDIVQIDSKMCNWHDNLPTTYFSPGWERSDGHIFPNTFFQMHYHVSKRFAMISTFRKVMEYRLYIHALAVFWGYQENQISSKNFKDKCRQFLSQKLYIMHGIVAYFLLSNVLGYQGVERPRFRAILGKLGVIYQVQES